MYDRLGGTITWLPAVGRAIDPGDELFAVDGAPVVLFVGATPSYRELAAGVSDGADVLELNRDLVNLGFDPEGQIALDDHWQSGTTDAVRRWQASRGLPQTGIIALGRIVFLPGAQIVTAVDPQLGSDAALSSPSPAGRRRPSPGRRRGAPARPGHTPSSSTSRPPPRARAPARAARGRAGHFGRWWRPRCARRGGRVFGRRRLPGRGQRLAAARGGAPPAASSSPSVAALERLVRADTQQLKADAAALRRRPTATPPAAPSGQSRSGGAGPGFGSVGGASDTAILQTASTGLVVDVALSATMRSEAVVGEAVTVQLPDGTTVGGRITQVSPVAQTPSASPASGANGSGGNGSGGTELPPRRRPRSR